MTHQRAVRRLVWLLAPFAVLAVMVLVVLLCSFLGGRSDSYDPWTGERLGKPSGDWFWLCTPLGLLIYLVLGLWLWITLIRFAYFPEDISMGPFAIWGSVLGFNLLASIYWIILAAHVFVEGASGGGYFLLPLLVTIPVAGMSTRFLFKRSP